MQYILIIFFPLPTPLRSSLPNFMFSVKEGGGRGEEEEEEQKPLPNHKTENQNKTAKDQ